MSIKVILDAGHGSDTWKRTGGKGVKHNGAVFEEHSFNAAVVGYTKELLECNGIEVLLTQPLNGNEVPLGTRTAWANKQGAKALISFHADANGNPEAKGHWVFFWHTSANGKRLAQVWDKHADQLLGNSCRGIQESKPGLWTNFHMVRETSMPSILVEHAFMTNTEDLQRLQSDSFRRKCAEVAAKAICEYCGVNYKEGDTSDMTFKDTKGHWAEQAIETVAERRIMGGFSDGTFRPNEPMTRAQMAKVVSDILKIVDKK
ncbi:N-acetylmuramoyl-L-alanine amidase [Paenibacillus sp. NPDC093718]|uniref:N-acetylmuramoyl-L-alanine amidase n=1 Tax=Paenibacillus sp. NPDC093718 TaxID=3390601 RepID=UPI003D0853B0